MIEDGDEQLNEENEEDELEDVAKAASKRSASASKESERRKRELITMGKAKGFLTYDEVNDHMPETIVSSDQIDDWLSTLGGEGIEIVDSGSSVKVSDKAEAGGPEEEAAPERREEAEEEEEEDGYSKTND